MPLAMTEVTRFRGVLPPERNGQGCALPPSSKTPGGLILNALSPLRGDLDAAIERNDYAGALHLAYGALIQVADALAGCRRKCLRPGEVRVHALLIELDPLPLKAQPDGVLAERGTAVTVDHRHCTLQQAEARRLAQALEKRLLTMWPEGWRIVVHSAPDPQPQPKGLAA